MTQPSEITDDLTRVLALAKRALSARDDAAGWSRSPEKQTGHHGACCDALWTELERLVLISDGIIPAIEHPAARERRIAKEIRGRIVEEILEIARDRLETTIDGAFVWEEPGALTRHETEELM
ncbi:hypothetical protein [Pseudosulfitobacter pseudonitzschiae]|uniref:hypothetical protein n=1 Tax=Pseudosulfitobacter pseudonitzschiae TaxID=1402135 RepID=UPI001AF3C4F8|nr:hypothetical protein [Pseudosulfitobacter pseudonitzschiae]MBM1814524.1 hypothetical protein [Pseudosulfitobacter pseudonitzschiae]MBM1831518.1 hypothetical protein [Pseudosulfitobacter pseudonitzschiae]MBM1836384.1 hypothetical protein [Pseudosulfitobacter pseudonitzschiae]MBM1841230.1 hypothetical protein [Pseudosulfitobacter pseudonitzschiae]MBM1846098.1 hypothetical protein [Pseudosulfitobacter pseudonitzschiae]